MIKSLQNYLIRIQLIITEKNKTCTNNAGAAWHRGTLPHLHLNKPCPDTLEPGRCGHAGFVQGHLMGLVVSSLSGIKKAVRRKTWKP